MVFKVMVITGEFIPQSGIFQDKKVVAEQQVLAQNNVQAALIVGANNPKEVLAATEDPSASRVLVQQIG